MRRFNIEKFVSIGTITPIEIPPALQGGGYLERLPGGTNAPYGWPKMMLVQSQAYRTEYGLIPLPLPTIYTDLEITSIPIPPM
jgi:hypothetical protein